MPILLALIFGVSPAMAGDPPIPKRKPDLASQPMPAVPATGVTPVAQTTADPPPQITPDAACEARLADLGVAFEILSPVMEADSCKVSRPLRITHLAPDVAFLPDGTLTCLAAEALARWTQRVLLPASKETLGKAPSGVRHGSTYVCRSRNSGKPSEHALGNAVDIVGFDFAERAPVTIAPRAAGSGPERSFQARIRRGACAYFTTVLGPGTDDAHADHLHFDLRQRKRGYRICQ